MTLRDYLAAKAMQSIVSAYQTPQLVMNQNNWPVNHPTKRMPDTERMLRSCGSDAYAAYAMADAMLAARSNGGNRG
jgi:hypothetical protein